ncbi:DUF3772 domain-containing protein [Roseateles violae]|uniref:DUF3772 domain-containing protein n=1 Tax=Roseateles violae TaxID=3058042 RepID=A0ABT8DPB8_9BURK|nr:DUF3772 domain-containing protein [Pelomonas sp. PFR6]MDN3919853.1 DUF3772 domain-containing protein [Pelomonas sp. PFR6]
MSIFKSFCLLLLSLGLLAGAARAQDPAEIDASLDAARQQVERLKKRLQEDQPGNAELIEYRQKLLGLQQQAQQIAQQQQPAFDSAQARLSELGPEPTGVKESADVAEQRRVLKKSSEQLGAQLKLARLLALESEQLAEEIGGQRRARFRAELFERSDSLLSTAFWDELRSGAGRDGHRLEAFEARVRSAAATTPPQRWLALALLPAAAIVLRLWLKQRVAVLSAERAPPGRVRRSLLAVARALLAMLVPGVAAYALMQGISGGLSAGDPMQELAQSIIGAVCFSAYITGCGRAVLSPKRPSWRLLPIPDSVASGLRWYPALLGTVTFAGWFLLRLAAAAPLNLALEVIIIAADALLLSALLVHIAHRGERLRRQAAAEAGEAPRPPWLSLILFGSWAILAAVLLSILVGYVALGSFIVHQACWVAVLLLTAYLLNLLIDDAIAAWLGGAARARKSAAEGEGGPPSRKSLLRNQLAELGSGVLRLTVWLLTLVLIVAPFGESPGDLLNRTDQLRVGLSIGELQLRPTIVLQALIVFLLAKTGLRLLRDWLDERFLPTTTLDAGMRNSVTTLFGFMGLVLAIGMGLSALGLALDKVAWIASALSVGIGFGLQAVVSNFVSGLILLAERPVKVGDWVALGGVEGDIRRINVRATEIQMADRSTLIVPNSEFITKVVRNVTHESPAGLVQIKLPMPLDTDTGRVSEILLRAFVEHEEIMAQPPAKVQLDGIEAGNLVFNATGSVGSPRQSYAVRSALLFRILQDLHAAGLPLRNAPSLVLREQSPPPPPAAPNPEPSP